MTAGRKNGVGQRRKLLRRVLFLTLVFVLLLAAYRVFRVGGGAPPSSSSTQNQRGGRAAPRFAKAEEYLQLSTRNTSLRRRDGEAATAVLPLTALDARVNAVLQRRWSDTAGAEAARVRPVRVRVATVANYVDHTVCAAQASALASGVNVTLIGFNQPYSHVTRLKTFLNFAEQEGLADEDVVMFVDSDVLWTGMGLEDALAKFAAFSPTAPASLWPAAVRAWEDYGEVIGERFLRSLVQNSSRASAGAAGATALLQLPPVLFSAERYCNWMQYMRGMPPCTIAISLVDYITDLVRNGRSEATPEKMSRWLDISLPEAVQALEGVQRFLAARQAGARRNSAPPRWKGDPFYFASNAYGDRNVMRFLNGGGSLMRVWALRRYAAVVDDFVQTQKPIPALAQGSRGWFCDQSIHGPMYARGRMFEAAHGLLEALPGAENNAELAADPPYGLPAGMTGLDRRSEFFFNAAGVLIRLDRNYVGTEYYQRFAGYRVFRLLWYIRRLRTWWIPGESVSAVRRGPTTSASGCALTPLLLRRPPCREDVGRGYRVMRDDDADVAVAPVVHIPGNDKDEKYAKVLRYIPWRVAAQWSCMANETLFRVLESAEVEVWGPNQRHYLPLRQMCPSIPFLE